MTLINENITEQEELRKVPSTENLADGNEELQEMFKNDVTPLENSTSA